MFSQSVYDAAKTADATWNTVMDLCIEFGGKSSETLHSAVDALAASNMSASVAALKEASDALETAVAADSEAKRSLTKLVFSELGLSESDDFHKFCMEKMVLYPNELTKLYKKQKGLHDKNKSKAVYEYDLKQYGCFLVRNLEEVGGDESPHAVLVVKGTFLSNLSFISLEIGNLVFPNIELVFQLVKYYLVYKLLKKQNQADEAIKLLSIVRAMLVFVNPSNLPASGRKHNFGKYSKDAGFFDCNKDLLRYLRQLQREQHKALYEEKIAEIAAALEVPVTTVLQKNYLLVMEANEADPYYGIGKSLYHAYSQPTAAALLALATSENNEMGRVIADTVFCDTPFQPTSDVEGVLRGFVAWMRDTVKVEEIAATRFSAVHMAEKSNMQVEQELDEGAFKRACYCLDTRASWKKD